MIKLIASDMDGTLLNEDSQLPIQMENVLNKLEEENIAFVAASGRSLRSIENTFGDLANRICIVSDNGAAVKHKGELVFSSVIKEDDWKAIAKDCLRAKETSVVLVGVEKAFKIIANKEHEEILGDYFSYAEVIESIDEVDTEIIKITLLSVHSTKDNFDNLLYPLYKDDFAVVFGGQMWIDFMNKDIDKGTGLQKLLELYEVDPKHVMAFGDYHNDIEMLRLAEHSYAVENAHDVVKSVAKEIIGSNNDNAVVNKILEHI